MHPSQMKVPITMTCTYKPKSYHIIAIVYLHYQMDVYRKKEGEREREMHYMRVYIYMCVCVCIYLSTHDYPYQPHIFSYEFCCRSTCILQLQSGATSIVLC